MRDNFIPGIVAGMLLASVIWLTIVSIVDEDWREQQNQWVDAGALQYNPRTGEIEPVRCDIK